MKYTKRLEGEAFDEEELDITSALITGGMIDGIFYLEDLRQRKLFLRDVITTASVAPIIRHIMQFNAEDKEMEIKPEDRMPILLYISSRGGEEDAGFALVDAIRCSNTPVYTINLGFEYSMAFLIGLAGHKRYSTKSAVFMMHDGAACTQNSLSKFIDESRFYEKTKERNMSYVLSMSNLSEEEYKQKERVEWYMFADEAKEHGFVDFIIGEDCDMDDII